MKPKTGQAGGPERTTGRRKWPPEVCLQVAQAVVDWASRYRRLGADPKAWWQEGVTRRRRRMRERGADARREAVVQSRRAHPEQGTRRIRDVMARFQGLGVSETTVRRILHEEGLLETVPEPAAKPGPPEQRFERAEPNQLWQSDIFTFLLRRHQRLYVAAFMDDYSRYLVSLVVAHHQRSSLVMEALARGIAEYGAPREVLTDQGRQYVAWRGHTDFEEELRRQGIRHIKSRPHHPQTLGKIERFWKTLWEEFLSRTVFSDFEDCQRRIGLFVQAYNFRRPHQGIGGAVPADRFFRAAPQVRAAIEKSVANNALALAKERPQRKPFYLVGRFGERDLTVVLSGSGLVVRVGEVEETIPLRGEEADETTQAGPRVAEASCEADAEVAAEVGGDRQDRPAAVLDGAERAFGGDPGERRHPGGGDLAGDVLPAGDTGSGGDAAGAGAAGERGGAGDEPGAADRSAGGEGEGAGAGEPALAAAAADDAAGDPEPGAENRLDPVWQKSFAELDDEEAGKAAGSFDPGSQWREHALSWERKLSGSEAGHGLPELHSDAGGAAGAGRPLRGDRLGAVGTADGERGGETPGALPEPLPEPDAPGAGVAARGAGPQTTGASSDTGAGAAARGGDGEAAAGSGAAQEAGGVDRSHPQSGERAAAGPDGTGDEP